jgi:hypothetical protein
MQISLMYTLGFGMLLSLEENYVHLPPIGAVSKSCGLIRHPHPPARGGKCILKNVNMLL